MLSNYLKTLVRSLWKNKGYSALNIVGLSVGIACAALIFLWVRDEKGFDDFHLKKDLLYYVKVNQDYDNYVSTFSSTPGIFGPALKADFPGIANTCRYSESADAPLFTVGDKAFYAEGHYAEASLFDMFTLPFEEGNVKTAFSSPYSLVITHTAAIKFFGTASRAVGKTVRVDNKHDFMVTGVLRDLPGNSSLQFEWLAPFQLWLDQNPNCTTWGNFCLTTFAELKPGVDPASIDRQLANYIQRKSGGDRSTAHPFLFNMSKWRLYDQFDNGKPTGGGRIEYVRLFSAIAWIILFIACINFMNLATARSEQRAREVGVRKVLGAHKRWLVAQFIGEALLMALISALMAVLIVGLALPAFNLLVEKNLRLDPLSPAHLISLFAITVVCGLVAGSYPALYLSSFRPVVVLKGKSIAASGATLIRKGLVVTQFTVSIVLIISTVVIFLQISHAKSRNLGFNKNNLLQVRLQGPMLQNFPVIQQDLLSTGVLSGVALTDHETIEGGNNTGGIQWEGKSPNSSILISQRLVSPDFLSVMGMLMVSGRDFDRSDIHPVSDSFPSRGGSINVIITSSLEKLISPGAALGKILRTQVTGDAYLSMRVIGVVQDYVYDNMYGKSDPVVFLCLPQFATLMYARIRDGRDINAALATLGAVIKKDNPGYPFEYIFVDDQFNEMFTSEMLVGRLSRVFAALAILISCLGLFGLAAYTAERRTKEIGIRKVLGANVPGIAALLSKEFLQLVLVSCLIAFPLAWWLMGNWLQSYPYHIAISWWVFIAAGGLAFIIALATIVFHSIKAAVANPINSLRSE